MSWNSEPKIAISSTGLALHRLRKLQEARNLLESEEERIQREMARYIKLIQMALASVKIISETTSSWHQPGHPMRKFVTTRSPAENSTSRMGHD